MTRAAELVAAAKAGDEVAFSLLVNAEAKWAYATARAIVGTGADAEDVFQEACLRAWRDLPRLRDADLWRPWFHRILTRAAIDHARATRRIREIGLPDAGSERDKTDQVAARDQIFRALGALAPDERAVLVLRFGQDLELGEVALLMGLPIGTTKSKLHRSLRKLRDHIGRET